MRFLGIDPGTKRLGLATGDDMGLASPLPALTQATANERWAALLIEIRQRRVTELVLGYPLNMDDSVGPKARESEAFAVRLREATGLPVHLVDERLTSHVAESSLPKHKLREMRASGVIDSRAAAIILQDYLDQRFPPMLMEEPE
ncbi:Holliday junction resolvase RuvX [Synoicihabitans lomoniglobus]|uniref:Putative pre-16S rRNA nuclease n=1 Tax=Synoicihabitans lomoniglobus TaxID=2909285 RepID=A0AAF0CQR6_9BACT|nr:Holliday junction resolvase RuvX [Opitutaceae bacterium LMO-M01]WED66317.1 Holliday junction resolvase RuvX [Opitutaceae bacterium LMO-M01]